jgi:hypothetical protein
MHSSLALASALFALAGELAGCQLVTRARTGGSASTAASTGNAERGATTAVETQDGQVTSAYRNMAPYPDAPTDPWAAVEGDQPRRMSKDAAVTWSVRDNDFACTSAHDHCFAAGLWMIESDDAARQGTFRVAAAYGFGPDGPVLPLNAKTTGLPPEPYTAYRTVPATRTNLVPGAHVFALTFPRTQLTRGSDVFNEIWNTGVVDRVDWDLGFVYLAGQDRSYWITATRTAALSWRPGGNVEVVGGRPRDSLAVRKEDVILPDPASAPQP